MRYYVIFGITAIILALILFYNPNSKYLGVYENIVNIEYDYNDKGYNWIYEDNNDNLLIDKINDNKWTLKVNKDGEYEINFYYTDSTKEKYKYKIYYKFIVKNDKIYWLNGEAKGLLDYPNPY